MKKNIQLIGIEIKNKWPTSMVIDSIKKFASYFINSKKFEKNQTTMNTAIVANNDVQSLYTIVENCLKDNVSRQYANALQNAHFVFNTNRSSVRLFTDCFNEFIALSFFFLFICFFCVFFSHIFINNLLLQISEINWGGNDHHLVSHWFFCVKFKVFWTLGATLIVILIATVIIIWQRWFNKGKPLHNFFCFSFRFLFSYEFNSRFILAKQTVCLSQNTLRSYHAYFNLSTPFVSDDWISTESKLLVTHNCINQVSNSQLDA